MVPFADSKTKFLNSGRKASQCIPAYAAELVGVLHMNLSEGTVQLAHVSTTEVFHSAMLSLNALQLHDFTF